MNYKLSYKEVSTLFLNIFKLFFGGLSPRLINLTKPPNVLVNPHGTHRQQMRNK